MKPQVLGRGVGNKRGGLDWTDCRGAVGRSDISDLPNATNSSLTAICRRRRQNSLPAISHVNFDRFGDRGKYHLCNTSAAEGSPAPNNVSAFSILRGVRNQNYAPEEPALRVPLRVHAESEKGPHCDFWTCSVEL